MTHRMLPAFLLVLLSAGCATQDAINKNYDISKVRRIGALKFNYGNFPEMGAEDIFAQYMIERGFNIIERSRLEALLQEQKLATTGLFSQGTHKNLGRLLGVDALLLGQLTQYVPTRSEVVTVHTHRTFEEPLFETREKKQQDGSVIKVKEQVGSKVRHEQSTLPQSFHIDATVGITAKLVDVETGEIIWIGSYATEGVNGQVALESAASYLAHKLAKQWKVATH